MKRAARLWQTETRGGRNKEELSPTTTTVTDKCGECFFRVGSGSVRWSLGRRGSGIRSLTHPTRVSVSLSSRCGTPVPCLPPPLRQSSPLLLLLLLLRLLLRLRLLLLLPLPPLLGFKAQWKKKGARSEWVRRGWNGGPSQLSALSAPPCRPRIRSDTAGTLWCRWTWADRSPAGGGEERRGEEEACIDWGVNLQQAWQWKNETQDFIMLSESGLILLYCTWDQCNQTVIKTWWCCVFFKYVRSPKETFCGNLILAF